jgi:serine/threonine protein kinase
VFDVLPELSQAGREVLAGLLRFDPEERLTAADALEYPWFKEDVKASAVAFVTLTNAYDCTHAYTVYLKIDSCSLLLYL